ncbi:MAG: hypothetical protein M3Y79_02480 [Pseudomonadota bacterium]|nr:hypothetical protein [Pseudomonadota bacterium]
MNCQDIERILDDVDVTGIDAEMERAVDSHLRTCPQCARDWQLQQRLARKELPVMPAELAARCAKAARVSSGAAGRVRRLVVVGALTLAAAAALWLGTRQPPAVIVPAPALANAAQEPREEVQAAAPPTEVAAGAPDSRTTEDTPPANPSAPLLSIWVLPTEAGSEDVAIRSAARQLHESLVEALRAIPDAHVREGESAAGRGADYVLQISKETLSTPDPEGMWRFQVSVQVPRSTLSSEQIKGYEQVQSVQGMGGATVPGYIRRFGYGTLVSLQVPCKMAMCPAKQAAEAVESIRLNAFRLDRAKQQEVFARFRESGTDFATRLKLLGDLNTLTGTGRATPVDAQFARAILDMHADASDRSQRLRLWRALDNYTDNAMIEPILWLVRQETDTQVRAMLVSQLVKNFRSDETARKALEEIAVTDASGLVRQLARRAAEGNEAWHKYLRDTLQDRTLSSHQRWEPVDYLLNVITTGSMGMAQQSLARLDNVTIAALAEVLPEVWAGWSLENDPGRVIRLQNLFSSLNDLALAELLLKSLDGGSPFSRSTIVTLLQKYVDDPVVRERLERLREEDADTKVREAAGRVLAKATPALPRS